MTWKALRGARSQAGAYPAFGIDLSVGCSIRRIRGKSSGDGKFDTFSQEKHFVSQPLYKYTPVYDDKLLGVSVEYIL